MPPACPSTPPAISSADQSQAHHAVHAKNTRDIQSQYKYNGKDLPNSAAFQIVSLQSEVYVVHNLIIYSKAISSDVRKSPLLCPGRQRLLPH